MWLCLAEDKVYTSAFAWFRHTFSPFSWPFLLTFINPNYETALCLFAKRLSLVLGRGDPVSRECIAVNFASQKCGRAPSRKIFPRKSDFSKSENQQNQGNLSRNPILSELFFGKLGNFSSRFSKIKKFCCSIFPQAPPHSIGSIIWKDWWRIDKGSIDYILINLDRRSIDGFQCFDFERAD